MRLGSLILTCVLLIGLCGCGNKVKQTVEDAEISAQVAEKYIRVAQATGTELDAVIAYNGETGGQMVGPGFMAKTGFTGTFHFRANPREAVDKTPVGPPRPKTPESTPGSQPALGSKPDGDLIETGGTPGGPK